MNKKIKEKTVEKTTKKLNFQTSAGAVVLHDQGSIERIPPDELAPGELPPDIADRIQFCIDNFCEKENIKDLKRERSLTWGACCMYVGMSIFKNSLILHDRPRERKEGGVIYDAGRLCKLADVFAYLCGTYNKTILKQDFFSFSGLGVAWDKLGGVGLSTSGRSDLSKKIDTLQESMLTGQLADGRQNPVGPLAILNRLYWDGRTEQKEDVPPLGVADGLPILGPMNEK